MAPRIKSYRDFWPYYLSEHKNSTSRRLHFVGTSGWIASLLGSLALNPVGFGAAMAVSAAAIKDAAEKGEDEGASPLHIAAAVLPGVLASPVVYPAGVVFAYGCAWLGHFGFEKNKPATFNYPMWSLISDFKMYGHMLKGQLWSGDPLEELGLDDPQQESEPTVATRATVEA